MDQTATGGIKPQLDLPPPVVAQPAAGILYTRMYTLAGSISGSFTIPADPCRLMIVFFFAGLGSNLIVKSTSMPPTYAGLSLGNYTGINNTFRYSEFGPIVQDGYTITWSSMTTVQLVYTVSTQSVPG